MYISNYEIKRAISGYQLELLCYLERGYEIVTNEGSGFRAWLEKDRKVVEGVTVRKDSAEKLLVWGLMESNDIEDGGSRIFRYGVTTRAEQLLSLIGDVSLNAPRSKVSAHG